MLMRGYDDPAATEGGPRQPWGCWAALGGVYVVLVRFRAENLHHFYEWSGAALEREWGQKETEAFLAEYYGCLEESRQVAVVTEADA